MPKPGEIIEYYKKNNMPLKCYYCGQTDCLFTKDHVIPKSRVNRIIRMKRYTNKENDPKTYYGQFVLACEKCNRIKNSMTKDEFLAHIRKIFEYNNPRLETSRQINKSFGCEPGA